MEGTKDMTSIASNSTAAASAPHNHHQQQAVVSSPAKKGQATNSKKSRAAPQAGGSGDPRPQPPQDAAAAVRCPRCRSANNKFCYYNNYNLNQPRYFCKACSRYWTQGGSLRLVPFGGGSRRNRRASAGSSSSSAASSTAATSAEMNNTVKARLMMTAASTMSSVSSPTTGLLFPNGMAPTFTPQGGSGGGLDVAMGEGQQGFLPFAPLSLSDHQAPQELAPTGFLHFAPLSLSDEQALELELVLGGSDTTPTLLDMLTGGYSDAGGSSSSYDAGLAMSAGSNEMDMSFLLPEMGASAAADPMDVAAELQWQSYINYDGGYAAEPAAGMEQQQKVPGDHHQDDNNKAKESSSKNKSPVYGCWINNSNNSDGGEW